MRALRNPMVDVNGPRLPMSRTPVEFHRRLEGYEPTALIDATSLAESRGLGHVLVKHEAQRFGLPAFKFLGGSWSVYRSLVSELGREPEWDTLEDLAEQVDSVRNLKFVTATDGNHGRGVAHMAMRLGLDAHIFLPEGSSQARIDAIRSEGAMVEVVDGDYDNAVATAAAMAGPNVRVVADTPIGHLTQSPKWVMEAYVTIFVEIEEQIAAQALPRPDIVLVPLGVGALGAAMISYFWQQDPRPMMVGVEPETAACCLASVAAGKIVHVPGPHHSIMVGLNCGTPSAEAFPVVSTGLDWMISIEDSYAAGAMRELASAGIVAGETGAAALAGLDALTYYGKAHGIDRELPLGPEATVLVMVTEGATDAAHYEEIVGTAPELVGVPV